VLSLASQTAVEKASRSPKASPKASSKVPPLNLTTGESSKGQYSADFDAALNAADTCVSESSRIVDRGTSVRVTNAALDHAEAAALARVGGSAGGEVNSAVLRDRQENILSQLAAVQALADSLDANVSKENKEEKVKKEKGPRRPSHEVTKVRVRVRPSHEVTKVRVRVRPSHEVTRVSKYCSGAILIT